MTGIVRVDDTCYGYCEELRSNVTATFVTNTGANAHKTYNNGRSVCVAPAYALAPCGNYVVFTDGSPTVRVRDQYGVIRYGDIGYCQNCGNSFMVTSNSNTVLVE